LNVNGKETNMQKVNSDCTTLVLGIGNEILTDEGIGPKMVKKLEVSFPHEDIQYKTACVGGLEILNYIHGYDEVIFIDTIKTKNGDPGDVYFFSPENGSRPLKIRSRHN